jgi:hypothetical protein
MPIKKPSTDNFTKNIQKITPKSIDTKSVKFKDDIISSTVNSITSEIKNKVCGVIDLAIAIQSGISNIASSIGDINLESFINSGVSAVKDVLGEAKDLIEDTATAIADNAKNLLSEIEDQIENIDDNIEKGIEGAKLAAQGLLEAPANIAKFTNKLLRDMSLDGNLRNIVCDEEVEKAKNNMIDKAKNQTSQFKVSTDQIEKLNLAATNLVDDTKILEKEQLSEFENTYSTNFSSRSNPGRRRR